MRGMDVDFESRFLRYVAYDTGSQAVSDDRPSTTGQRVFGEALVREMTDMGIADARIDNLGCVYGSIPSNMAGCRVPAIGFIAHMDTVSDVCCHDINAEIIRNYDGGDIVLDRQKNIVLSPAEYERLRGYAGQDIVVTGGNTILGGDDKAGITEIMAVCEYLLNNPDFKHGDVKIAFTTDEEIGRGADGFDVEGFAADFAFILDNSYIGNVSYENFNAADADVLIKGKAIHPGDAKGKMINAILVGNEFVEMMPTKEIPANTEGYEGYIHITSFVGAVDHTELKYAVRYFADDEFQSRKRLLLEAAETLNDKYGCNTVEVKIKDKYCNMKDKISPCMHIVDNAVKAMEMAEIEPLMIPMRGGTDGVRLSFMGLTCLSLCSGTENSHSVYEYLPVQSMEKIAAAMLNVLSIYAQSCELASD